MSTVAGPLVLTWAAMAIVFRAFGVGPDMIRQGSILALVPLWFLAVYLLVVLLVPVTRAAWERGRMLSFWTFVAAAVVVDVLRFHDGHRPGVGWLNYVFVWTAMPCFTKLRSSTFATSSSSTGSTCGSISMSVTFVPKALKK